jgi:hypothetical protein
MIDLCLRTVFWLTLLIINQSIRDRDQVQSWIKFFKT